MQCSHEEHLALLRLSATPGIGSNKLRTLVNCFDSASAVFEASAKRLTTIHGIDRKIVTSIRQSDTREFAERQMLSIANHHADLVSLWDSRYPEALRQIYDPPPFLFVRGSIKADDQCAVGVVGMRRPSSYGKLVTSQVVAKLAVNGITTISGLAYGVDTIAHQTAVRMAGRTIAVLGSGVDVIYPAENRSLAERIVTNGAVLSEFPMGSQPDRNNFPRRNRIISGMSLGVVVIEAGLKSGALLTADFAVEQNREVFAVPGNITSPTSLGTNALIKQGAYVLTDPHDILTELRPKLAASGRSVSSEQVHALQLEAEELHILHALHHEPRHIDWISHAVKMPSSKVLALLLMLELKSLVKQEAGKMFVRL